MSLAILAWLHMAGLASLVWIPAFAGMTGRDSWRTRPPTTRASVRDTLILAFSHQGRRDLSLAILAWFHVAGLVSLVWIPAFAGMTGREGYRAIASYRFQHI